MKKKFIALTLVATLMTTIMPVSAQTLCDTDDMIEIIYDDVATDTDAEIVIDESVIEITDYTEQEDSCDELCEYEESPELPELPEMPEMSDDEFVDEESVWEEELTEDEIASYEASADVALNETNFPDEVFRNRLAADFDADGNGYIASKITRISYGVRSSDEPKITNVKGIELFPNLEVLELSGQELTSIDVSKNPKLTWLSLNGNDNLASLDVSNNPMLEYLRVGHTDILYLDLSNNQYIEELNIDSTSVTNVDFSALKYLEVLSCEYTSLTSIDVSSNTNILGLYCTASPVSSVKLSPSLRKLECAGCELESISFPINSQLWYVNCSSNKLTSLDVSNLTKLEELGCGGNELTSIKFAPDSVIKKLYAQKNQLVSVDAKNLPKVEYVALNANKLTSIDVSKCTELKYLQLHFNDITYLDISNNLKLEFLHCGHNNVQELKTGNNANMIALCCYANALKSLDVSKMTALEDLRCWDNRLEALNTNNNSNLKLLSCEFNKLASLNLTNNTKLEILYVEENKLTNINVSMCSELWWFECGGNLLTSLDVSNNTKLRFLGCGGNGLTSLDISNNPELSELNYNDNFMLNGIDISNNPKLDALMINQSIDSQFDPNEGPNGIYVSKMDQTGITAGAVLEDKGIIYSYEFSWYASKDEGKTWILVQDWARGNEWLNWTPAEYGEYILVCKSRLNSLDSTIKQVACNVAYHPEIKGICQMPYEGEGGGYLIGLESYNNPNGKYSYEMLILDCTLLAEGKDAWTYSTGRCYVPDKCLWTVWQPLYGYYWTLFRVYDESGKIIDEKCYGFANVCDESATTSFAMEYGQSYMSDYNMIEENIEQTVYAGGEHEHVWSYVFGQWKSGHICNSCWSDAAGGNPCSHGGYYSNGSWCVRPNYYECVICHYKEHTHYFHDSNYCSGCGSFVDEAGNLIPKELDGIFGGATAGFEFEDSDIVHVNP